MRLFSYTAAAGYYIYIETSSGSNGHKARLESPTLTGSTQYCLDFYYHMYGSTIGSLKVYAKTTSLGSALWTQSGTKGNQWLLGQVPFSTAVDAKVMFSLVFDGLFDFFKIKIILDISNKKRSELIS